MGDENENGAAMFDGRKLSKPLVEVEALIAMRFVKFGRVARTFAPRGASLRT